MPEPLLAEVLEAARLAPSAANRQPWDFILISDERQRQKLREAYDRPWFSSAPHILVACADPEQAWTRGDGTEYWMADAAIAVCQLTLACAGAGLGTCWIANFDEGVARRILGVPEKVRIVAMTPIGYPAEEKGEVEDRKPMTEILHREKW
jgi:nitroreductase